MSIQLLPPDIATVVFGDVVRQHGIRHSTHLRIVCKTFDIYIRDAIFRLPAFDYVDNWSPPHLRRDARMSKDMVKLLILSKLHDDYASKRALTSEIDQTVQYVSSHFQLTEEFARDEYTSALATLAAKYLPLQEIVRHLEIGSIDDRRSSQLAQNALVATIYLGRQKHRSLVQPQTGAHAYFHTRFFGSPLSIAAAGGHNEAFYSLFPAPSTSVSSGLVLAFRMEALVEAAASGNRDLVDFLVGEGGLSRAHPQFDAAIKAAMRASYEDLALTLLHLREEPKEIVVDGARWDGDQDWRDMLQVACSYNCERIVRFILDKTDLAEYPRNLDAALEEAVYHGNKEIVCFLLSKVVPGNLTSHTDALFWAGRHGHLEILDLLFSSVAHGDFNGCMDALCGAFYDNKAAVTHIVDNATSYGIDIQWRDRQSAIDSECFADIIDELLDTETANTSTAAIRKALETSATAREYEDLMNRRGSFAVRLIRSACKRGDLMAVRRIVSSYKTQIPRNNVDRLTCCCRWAASWRQPSILLYLCERVPQYLFAPEALGAMSTAIFQMYLDRGWDINRAQHIWTPPPLEAVVTDERLTRWFLDHGADPNARENCNATPLSIAVWQSPMSTVQLLLERGGDVQQGELLIFAMRRDPIDRLAVVDLLVRLGAPVSVRLHRIDARSYKNGESGSGTPLHEAVRKGAFDCVEYLLAHGANIRLKDRVDRTALALAEELGFVEIAEILRAAQG